MYFFHNLLENSPGKGEARPGFINGVEVTLPIYPKIYRPSKSPGVSLMAGAGAEEIYVLKIDPRDKRTLVVVDGELLWESIPKSGDLIKTETLGNVYASVGQERAPRFGKPWYEHRNVSDGVNQEHENCHTVRRHFLLLPRSNFMFCKVRNMKSLGPKYVFGRIWSVIPDAPVQIEWMNTN